MSHGACADDGDEGRRTGVLAVESGDGGLDEGWLAEGGLCRDSLSEGGEVDASGERDTRDGVICGDASQLTLTRECFV